MDLATQAALARDLAAMESSPAWEAIRAHLREASLASVKALGAPGTMQEQQVHFTRGAIWAFEELLALPPRLRLAIDNEIAMVSAKAKLADREHT
jgi:hypothetical protein